MQEVYEAKNDRRYGEDTHRSRNLNYKLVPSGNKYAMVSGTDN